MSCLQFLYLYCLQIVLALSDILIMVSRSGLEQSSQKKFKKNYSTHPRGVQSCWSVQPWIGEPTFCTTQVASLLITPSTKGWGSLPFTEYLSSHEEKVKEIITCNSMTGLNLSLLYLLKESLRTEEKQVRSNKMLDTQKRSLWARHPGCPLPPEWETFGDDKDLCWTSDLAREPWEMCPQQGKPLLLWCIAYWIF